MLKVNCIFQGGGANLATLLCAAEALEQLERAGFLQVSQVAGTSAGSIAAAAIAHKESMQYFNQRISTLAERHIKNFSIPQNRFSIAWRLLRGSPLIDERNLTNFLRELFKVDGRSYEFKDARLPLHICAADIKRSKVVYFRNSSDRPLEEALMESCAIPFVFRGYGTKSALADGGVMANLLDQDVFAADESESGGIAQTLAFSFGGADMPDFNSLPSYASTILGSMMQNAVSQSRVRIEQSGGYVCDLPILFGTTSFSGAIDKFRDDTFREDMVSKCAEKIKAGLEGFMSNSLLVAYGDRLTSVQKFADKAFDKARDRSSFRVTQCIIACRCFCLFGASDSRSKNPDIMIKRVVIEPTGRGMQFFRVGISKGSDYKLTKEIECQAYNSDGKLLGASFEVVSIKEEEEYVHRLFIVLDEWHPAEDGSITVSITTTHQQGIMADLKKPGGNDWMRAAAHRDDEIQEQDFILALPKDFGEVQLSDLKENVRRCVDPPKQLHEDGTEWVTGSLMSEDVIGEHMKWLQGAPAFKYVGWRCHNVPGRGSSGVLIERRDCV